MSLQPSRASHLRFSRTSPKRQQGRALLCWRFGLVILAFTAGCAGTPPPAAETAPPAPVEAVVPRTLFFGEWVELLGATQPPPGHSARISAAVEGHVVWLLKDPSKMTGLAEGDRVEKGQPVGQLDDSIVRANLAKLKAAEEEAQEQKRQAEFAVELALINVKALESFQPNGTPRPNTQVVSPVELQKARLALKEAESKQRAAEAKLKVGQAEIKAVEEQLQLYSLKAPIAGRLGPLQVVPGQTLAVGATVAEVISLDEIDVLCFVPPRTAQRLAELQRKPFEHALDARLPGEKEEGGPRGKVAFLAVQAQPETGTFAVKVRFPNTDLRLRANGVARVEVMTRPEEARLTVPESALLEDQDPPGIVVVEDVKVVTNKEGKEEKIGKARKLRAIVGIRDRRWKVVEILGLEDPEKEPDKRRAVPPLEEALIVTKGAHGLQTDDPVKLEEEEE